MAKYKKVSYIDKLRLIESLSSGEDYIALADCLGTNRNTAYTIVQRGRYKNLPKNGSYNRKIDEVSLDAIEILEGNPLMTLQQVNFAVRARLPQKPHFTQKALSKALEGRMTTFKIARDCPAKRSSEENIEDHYNYALWIMRPNVVSSLKNFVDEFGVNIYMRRSQGQSAKDNRVYRKVRKDPILKGPNLYKGPNLAIFCAVSTEGLLHYQVIQGEMKKAIFKSFFEVLYGNVLNDDGNVADEFCIFDNAPGHRGIEDMDPGGIFSLKGLRKYSPILILVEAEISCWKAAMKRKRQEEMDLFHQP